MIGSSDAQFISGPTDLRGVFVAEGPNGVITVLARRESNQYAFYRGTQPRGHRDDVRGQRECSRSAAAAVPGKPAQPGDQSLDANLRLQNSANSLRQIERLQQRYDRPAEKRKGAPAGEFR